MQDERDRHNRRGRCDYSIEVAQAFISKLIDRGRSAGRGGGGKCERRFGRHIGSPADEVLVDAVDQQIDIGVTRHVVPSFQLHAVSQCVAVDVFSGEVFRTIAGVSVAMSGPGCNRTTRGASSARRSLSLVRP